MLPVNTATRQFATEVATRYLTAEEYQFFKERETVDLLTENFEKMVVQLPPWQPLKLPVVTEKQKQRQAETLRAYNEETKRPEALYKDLLTRKGIVFSINIKHT